MKILSIRQPWASLIISGVKDVENRTWPTNYRGVILVHASQRADEISTDDFERRFGVRMPSELRLGGIVGTTEIVDCIRPHPSKWYDAERHGRTVSRHCRYQLERLGRDGNSSRLCVRPPQLAASFIAPALGPTISRR